MAALKLLLLSQSRRHLLSKPPSPCLVPFRRSLSSDPNPNPKQPPPIQPVSYAPKPPQNQDGPEPESEPDPSRQNTQQQQQRRQFSRRSPPSQEEARADWTREDIRYVKDAPSISPVSYPMRVAPLPEDRVKEGEGSGEGESAAGDMAKESQRIEAESRRRGFFRGVVVEEEEEKVVAPFPRLIKAEKNEKKAPLDLIEAIRQLKASARKTFDETVEAHVKLGIAKGRSDLIVRGTMTLPHGGNKTLRVAVFAEGADAEEARAAGADVVGSVELIDEIAKAGKIDFDKCLTTPKLYPRVAKLAKILNRHGLMPDSKQGTVVSDVSRAVAEAKKNQVKFRMDKGSIVHVGLGKVSFTEESIRENIGAFMNALLLAKPAGLKKTSKYAGYVNSFHICSTMGRGFPVSIQSLSKAVDHYNKLQLQ